MKRIKRVIGFLLLFGLAGGLAFTGLFAKQALSTSETTLLLVGVDEHGLTDSIALVVAGETVDIVSIPRDTLVDGRRINSLMKREGMPALITAVEKLTGLKVEAYVLIKQDRLPVFVDRVFPNGVEVNVPYRMKYRDLAANPPLKYDIKAGHRRLDGKRVLYVLRDRSDKRGAVGRDQRQVAVVKALIRQAVRSPASLARFQNAATQVFETDLSGLQIAGLLHRHRKLDAQFYRLPGEAKVIGGASYWVSAENAPSVLKAMMAAPGGAPIRVAIFNASGVDGAGSKAGAVLRSSLGIRPDYIGTAPGTRTTSTITVAPAGLQELAETMRQELGVPSAEIVVGRSENDARYAILEIGGDFTHKEMRR